jgi:hypothetical protein
MHRAAPIQPARRRIIYRLDGTRDPPPRMPALIISGFEHQILQGSVGFHALLQRNGLDDYQLESEILQTE